MPAARKNHETSRMVSPYSAACLRRRGSLRPKQVAQDLSQRQNDLRAIKSGKLKAESGQAILRITRDACAGVLRGISRDRERRETMKDE